MSALRSFWNYIVGPAPGGDDSGDTGDSCTDQPPPDQPPEQQPPDQPPEQPPPAPSDTPGPVTLPETTISVSPDQHDAYITGFQDGKSGAPSNAVDRVGLDLANDYESGYQDGQAAAAKAASSPTAADQEMSKEAYSCGFNDGQAEQRAGKCLASTDQDRLKYQAAGFGSFFEAGYSDGCKSTVTPQPDDSPDQGSALGPPIEGGGERSEETEKPEGFDEEGSVSRQEYGVYLNLKNRIAGAQRKIALGLMREKAWEESGLTDSDLHEYERLFEVFGPSDRDPVPPPGLSIEKLEEEPEETEIEEGEGE
jgi:hypothetical protein